MANPLSDKGVSDRDYAVAIGTLMGESLGQGTKGMAAVADVLANRVESNFQNRGDTIASQALSKSQFTTWSPSQAPAAFANAQAGLRAALDPEYADQLSPARAEAFQQAKEALAGVFGTGDFRGVSGGATYYTNPEYVSASQVPVHQNLGMGLGGWIGDHNFYDGSKASAKEVAARMAAFDWNTAVQNFKDGTSLGKGEDDLAPPDEGPVEQDARNPGAVDKGPDLGPTSDPGTLVTEAPYSGGLSFSGPSDVIPGMLASIDGFGMPQSLGAAGISALGGALPASFPNWDGGPSLVQQQTNFDSMQAPNDVGGLSAQGLGSGPGDFSTASAQGMGFSPGEFGSASAQGMGYSPSDFASPSAQGMGFSPNDFGGIGPANTGYGGFSAGNFQGSGGFGGISGLPAGLEAQGPASPVSLGFGAMQGAGAFGGAPAFNPGLDFGGKSVPAASTDFVGGQGGARAFDPGLSDVGRPLGTEAQVGLGFGGISNSGSVQQGSTATGPNFGNYYGGEGIVPGSRDFGTPEAYNPGNSASVVNSVTGATYAPNQFFSFPDTPAVAREPGSKMDNPLVGNTHEVVAGNPFAAITPGTPWGIGGLTSTPGFGQSLPSNWDDFGGAPKDWGDFATDGAGKGGSKSNEPSVSADMRGREQGGYGGLSGLPAGFQAAGDLPSLSTLMSGKESGGFGGAPAFGAAFNPDLNFDFSQPLDTSMKGAQSGGFGSIAGMAPAGFQADNSRSAPPGLDPSVWGAANDQVRSQGMNDFSSEPVSTEMRGKESGGFAGAAGMAQPGFVADNSKTAPPGMDPSVWGGANSLLTSMGIAGPSAAQASQVASPQAASPEPTPDIIVTPKDNEAPAPAQAAPSGGLGLGNNVSAPIGGGLGVPAGLGLGPEGQLGPAYGNVMGSVGPSGGPGPTFSQPMSFSDYSINPTGLGAFGLNAGSSFQVPDQGPVAATPSFGAPSVAGGYSAPSLGGFSGAPEAVGVPGVAGVPSVGGAAPAQTADVPTPPDRPSGLTQDNPGPTASGPRGGGSAAPAGAPSAGPSAPGLALNGAEVQQLERGMLPQIADVPLPPSRPEFSSSPNVSSGFSPGLSTMGGAPEVTVATPQSDVTANTTQSSPGGGFLSSFGGTGAIDFGSNANSSPAPAGYGVPGFNGSDFGLNYSNVNAIGNASSGQGPNTYLNNLPASSAPTGQVGGMFGQGAVASMDPGWVGTLGTDPDRIRGELVEGYAMGHIGPDQLMAAGYAPEQFGFNTHGPENIPTSFSAPQLAEQPAFGKDFTQTADLTQFSNVPTDWASAPAPSSEVEYADFPPESDPPDAVGPPMADPTSPAAQQAAAAGMSAVLGSTMADPAAVAQAAETLGAAMGGLPASAMGTEPSAIGGEFGSEGGPASSPTGGMGEAAGVAGSIASAANEGAGLAAGMGDALGAALSGAADAMGGLGGEAAGALGGEAGGPSGGNFGSSGEGNDSGGGGGPGGPGGSDGPF